MSSYKTLSLYFLVILFATFELNGAIDRSPFYSGREGSLLPVAGSDCIPVTLRRSPGTKNTRI